MFDLEQSIVEWRRKMLTAGIKSPVPLEELESHLREDIERNIRSGAAPDQAFAAAIKQIGDASHLRQEFEKVQDSKKARKRKLLLAVSVVAGAAVAYSGVFVTWFILRRQGRIEITRVEFLLVLGSMAVTILLGFAGGYFARFLPVVTREYLQAALIVTTIFLGACLWRLVWSFLSLDSLVHAQIVLLWTMSPWLGFVYCFGEWCRRCAAARRQMKTASA